MAMEHYFGFGTPQEADVSRSTAAVDTEMPASCTESGPSASGDVIPIESLSNSMEAFAPHKDFAPNVPPDVATDPRFRLGLEPGRWFAGSSGDVYELLDSIGSGSASTVYKCKKIRGKGEPQISDSPPPIETPRSEIAEDTVLAVKAIDLKGLRLNRNFDNEMEKLRREVCSASFVPA